MKTMLEVALDCLRRGWYVVPVKPPSEQSDGKGAHLTAHGENSASNDEAQIRRWWTKWPNANVAIAVDLSGLTVTDCDHGLTDEDSLRRFNAARGIPLTFTVRTGRRPDFAVHGYFQGNTDSFNGWKDGEFSGDKRGSWGYVLAPGSHHKSGERYEILWDLPVAPVPGWVRDLKMDKERKERVLSPTEIITEWRNDAMIRILGKAREAGLSDDLIRAHAIDVNDTRMRPSLDEDELERLIDNACKWEIGKSKPTDVVFKGAEREQPKPAETAERVRPVYPIEAWEGTAVYEFARLCGSDNNVPAKMYAEAFRCVLGSVVGDRVICPRVDGALPRTFTIIVAPKGKGKGTSIRRAVEFFEADWQSGGSSMPGLLSASGDFMWKPTGIGAWMTSASSVPGMARLTVEKTQVKTLKSSASTKWESTLPRILSVNEEMKTLLGTLFIGGGVGSSMEGVICQLWDHHSFQGTATGTRDASYGRMLFSLLCGVTEEDWFDLLSQGNVVGGGLMSRLNIIGTEGQFDNVSTMDPPNFAPLRESFLPRIARLEDSAATVGVTDAAKAAVGEWVLSLREGSERRNVHVWRNALLLSWLRHESEITEETARRAMSLGDYQTASHEYYRTNPADTANARVQAKIIRALTVGGAMKKRDLQRKTNATRDGTELWSRALSGLSLDGAIGCGEDGRYYLAE